MGEICGDRGIVRDPCFLCYTCGKTKGEDCHGKQFSLGICKTGLNCINANGTELAFEYEEGVCNDGGRPINLQLGQKCGGKFDYLGTCMPQSRCYVKEGQEIGVCAKYGML